MHAVEQCRSRLDLAIALIDHDCDLKSLPALLNEAEDFLQRANAWREIAERQEELPTLFNLLTAECCDN